MEKSVEGRPRLSSDGTEKMHIRCVREASEIYRYYTLPLKSIGIIMSLAEGEIFFMRQKYLLLVVPREVCIYISRV